MVPLFPADHSDPIYLDFWHLASSFHIPYSLQDSFADTYTGISFKVIVRRLSSSLQGKPYIRDQNS